MTTKTKKAERSTGENPFGRARKRLEKKLVGFSSDFPRDLQRHEMESSRPNTKDFPVPELVLLALRNVMGWRWSGHGEKVRWTVYGSVLGEPIAFELRKFGFTILRAKSAQVPQDRIVGQLRAALRELENELKPLADHQARRGAVLVVNRFGEFDSRCRFFREKARKSFRGARNPPKPKRSTKGGKAVMAGIADALNYVSRRQRAGNFYATAMIDAYFSALEHRLILLRAFIGLPLEDGGLTAFLSKRWDDKLRVILPVDANKPAAEMLGKLRRIKERLRNPFSHGGLENDGGSLFFHMPEVGVIPANFSNFADSPRFSFLPIEDQTFDECCNAFDALDKLLSSGALKLPDRFVVAGVDPSFDAASLVQYAEAIAQGEGAVEEWIARWGHEWETHANMDY